MRNYFAMFSLIHDGLTPSPCRPEPHQGLRSRVALSPSLEGDPLLINSYDGVPLRGIGFVCLCIVRPVSLE